MPLTGWRGLLSLLDMALCFSYHCAMLFRSSPLFFAQRAGMARAGGALTGLLALALLSACTVTRLPSATPLPPQVDTQASGVAVDPAGIPIESGPASAGAYPAATATPVPSASVQNLPPLGAGTATPPAPAVVGAGVGPTLQAGIFANASYAQSMAQKLLAADGGALVGLVRVQNDAGMHRVLVGPFATDAARLAGADIIERTTGTTPFTYRAPGAAH